MTNGSTSTSSLCTEDYQYKVTTYSPELRKEMVWLEQSRTDLGAMFEMLPEHVKPDGRFTRHAQVYRVAPNGSAGTLAVTSALTLYLHHRPRRDQGVRDRPATTTWSTRPAPSRASRRARYGSRHARSARGRRYRSEAGLGAHRPRNVGWPSELPGTARRADPRVRACAPASPCPTSARPGPAAPAGREPSKATSTKAGKKLPAGRA